MNELTTTIAVYRSDRAWLQARQLATASQRAAEGSNSPYLPMQDVIRQLIAAVEAAEMEGT